VPARPQTPFGDYLDLLLKARGLSVRAFAARVGSQAGSVSISKRKTMNPDRMIAWADALDLDGEERERFFDLATLTHAPTYLVRRFHDLVSENRRLKASLAKGRSKRM
jgi:transcriptional regulator with XRE-family HTH domain